MAQLLLLSTDSHVNEPPATWERIPAKFRVGVLGTELFGEDNYMWASDYPHAGSA